MIDQRSFGHRVEWGPVWWGWELMEGEIDGGLEDAEDDEEPRKFLLKKDEMELGNRTNCDGDMKGYDNYQPVSDGDQDVFGSH